jgi:Fe2+ or Zn2+ uptake regulation protein
MVKCPNQNCQNTEFKSERVSLDGGGVHVIVCKECETIIGISPKEIKSLLNEIKGKG